MALCSQQSFIIGRISRVSRQVASKQVILRAIERYGVSLHFRRNRLKQPKFRWKTTFWCKKRLDLGLEAAEKMNIAYPPLAWSQQLQFYKTMTFLGWDDLFFARKKHDYIFFAYLGFLGIYIRVCVPYRGRERETEREESILPYI